MADETTDPNLFSRTTTRVVNAAFSTLTVRQVIKADNTTAMQAPKVSRGVAQETKETTQANVT